MKQRIPVDEMISKSSQNQGSLESSDFYQVNSSAEIFMSWNSTPTKKKKSKSKQKKIQIRDLIESLLIFRLAVSPHQVSLLLGSRKTSGLLVLSLVALGWIQQGLRCSSFVYLKTCVFKIFTKCSHCRPAMLTMTYDDQSFRNKCYV